MVSKRTDWIIEYENENGFWEKIIDIKNWNEANFTNYFEYYLIKQIFAQKIKLYLTRAHGQERLLIKKFSLY
jgi:hypothetical protein